MRRLILIVLVAGAAAYAFLEREQPNGPAVESIRYVEADTLARAFEQQRSNVQVRASGTVERILSDDNDGSRHQRFIVRVASGQSILIAHNIDLAPRVASLAVGERVEFSGEYEWNNKGGVVHWTHRDPQGRHAGGWIEHDGKRYQ